MAQPTPQDYLAFGLCALAIIAIFLRRKKIKYPPGPPAWPFVGLYGKFPEEEYWRSYAEWGRLYGPEGIISYEIMGKRTIVLNSASAVSELLEKGSAIHSDRPVRAVQLLMRRHKSIFSMNYNDIVKRYRKLMHQDFNATASRQFWEVQEAAAYVLAYDLMTEPEQMLKCLKKVAAAIIMKIAYGYQVKSLDDHFVWLASQQGNIASLANGVWLVDSIPMLQYLPDWCPGAGFKRQIKAKGATLEEMAFAPIKYVKTEMVQGTAAHSFASQHLQPPVSPQQEADVTWTAAALYAGATDTTVAVVNTFVFLMLRHPDVQKRAQEEIDRVIGNERLPRITDRESLPYLDCVMKEVVRWNPPAPLGLKHAPSQDDEYLGYHIPKGCTVMANIWNILHEESMYPDPFKFDPDRFDSTKRTPQPDPYRWAFGFGRRICPGQYTGESMVFIEMACILAAFNVRRALDDQGHEVVPEPHFSTGAVSHVKEYPYRLELRSRAAEALVRNTVASMD